MPPPLVICLDDNWDTKGNHGPVCFAHPGAGSGETNSIKLCFRQYRIQPKIALIFWGIGSITADFDK